MAIISLSFHLLVIRVIQKEEVICQNQNNKTKLSVHLYEYVKGKTGRVESFLINYVKVWPKIFVGEGKDASLSPALNFVLETEWCIYSII